MNSRVNSRDRSAALVGSSDLVRPRLPIASPIGARVKRLMDFSLALVALVAFSPLFLLLAALVKLSDSGPVFYRHQRVGRNNASFPCLKFRTMAVNGDELLRRHLAENASAREEWETSRKLKRDPRITAIGRVLRKTSLDELPQLINIIRGDMSIVGPRPVVDDEITRYGSDARFYLMTRPGLTGPWQVSGRNDVSYETRVALDRQYVENWSLLTDIAIIVRTVPAVILARGY